MAEYVERDKILERMDLVVIYARGVSGDDPISKNITDIVAGMRDIVAMAPAADVAPVMYGEWVSLTDCANAGVYCSVCHKKVYKEDYAWCNKRNKVRSNYCPNCGAKMKDGE